MAVALPAAQRTENRIIPLTKNSCCGYCFAKPSEMEEPRALPCGHSQCTPCIVVDNRRRWMICKICREEFHGIEDITTLPLVPDEFIEAALTEAAEPKLPKFPCVLCRQNPLDAVVCCTTCKRRFCHRHAEEHEIHADDHRMIPIEYESAPDRYKVELCGTHTHNTLNSICKHCNERFCNHCCVTGEICPKVHTSGKNHKVVPLKEVTDDMREQLLKLNDDMYAKMKRCRNIEKSAWRDLSVYEDRVIDIHKEVDSTVDVLICKLREEGERLKQKFTDDYNDQAAEVDKFSEDTLVSSTELDDLFREGEELAERGSDMEVLTLFRELSNQMSDQINDKGAETTYFIDQAALVKGDNMISTGMRLRHAPEALEHVATEIHTGRCYGVNFDTEGNILCAVKGGVEVRAGDDLSLLRKINITGAVHTAQSTEANNFVVKVGDAGKYSTYIGTKDDPKQTLFDEVAYEGGGDISHISATNNRVAVVDLVNKQLRVFSSDPIVSLFSISLSDMTRPWGVHILSTNDAVLVTDWVNDELRMYPLQTNAAPIWICNGLHAPSGVTSDESGLIYATCNEGERIYLVSSQGKLLRQLSCPGLVDFDIHDVAVAGGRLTVANRDNGVSVFSLT